MNIAQIQQNLEDFVNDTSKEEFIFDLLRAYGLAKASITRLKKGDYDLSDKPNEIIWKKRLLFQEADSEHLHDRIDELSTNPKVRKHDLRFIIVTDHEYLLAEDTKTRETLDVPIIDLPKHFDFFLPWAGMEKTQHVNENPADVKAAEKLAKLYDEIKKENTTETEEEVHDLNVFLSRLLFCFFAEDTGIFEEGLFTNSISSHTQKDGSDLQRYLNALFDALDDKEKENVPEYLKAFPYVNGGLFNTKHEAPKFTKKSRRVIIECGELDWAAINPDIFGSMMQAVITREHREGLGIHYTSVPNIMKVIEPLFLNDLYDEFEKNKYKPKKLHQLLERLSKIKIFDPACGSGNFLIIAYKQLRYFEIKVLKQLQKIQNVATTLDSPQQELIPTSQLSLAASHQLPLFSRIQLSQFYGIEIDDFAHEVATLSLWLAEHQMNLKFKEQFGKSEPSLPLKDSGNIKQGNATRLDWETICKKEEGSEIFVLGNPPYAGQKKQSKLQKEDLKQIFQGKGRYKKLDYISCWFYKAAQYLEKNINYAFVSTNSVCQGGHVELLWPHILEPMGNEIFFAVKDFKWTNNAKKNAGVTCSIIGLRKNTVSGEKNIFHNGIKKKIENINAYLVNADNIIVNKRIDPISNIPKMISGNMALDYGHLMLSEKERNKIIEDYPESSKFIRSTTGGKNLLYGRDKWCLWIEDEELKEAKQIPPILKRINKCQNDRSNGGEVARTLVDRPHQFRYRHVAENNQIVLPLTSSERRDYIPIGFMDSEVIVQQSAQVLMDTEPYIFGLISSKIHMDWVRLVSGRMRMDISYSVGLSYNTFPFPEISDNKKQTIEKYVFRILEEREKHSEKTLAELYDPDKMPKGLRDAHEANDRVIEQCYRNEPFNSDEERLEFLFNRYEKMIAEEETK
jgi:type I restriction-modification system DNA methylase subunit